MNEPAAKPCVLIVDDEKNIRAAVQLALAPEGVHVIAAHDAAAALRAVREHVIDLVLLDIRLGDIDGLTLYRRIQADADIPTIFISGQATLTQAAQAVRIGGLDFIEKPFSAEKLVTVVRRCLEHASLQERLRRIEARAAGMQQIVGDSPAIRRVLDDVLRVAQTRATVLISGESGTGKELVASAIHDHSDRAAAPFVKVNCSAIPDTLVESELFGHERGAFTGATAVKRGLFEAAHRGTIFLDEIADLSAAAQAKILRVLQTGELQKVGSDTALRVDVRVLSGTHKDLRQLIAAGRFREDLFYRLNVLPIRLPALRDRAADLEALAESLLENIALRTGMPQRELTPSALAALSAHDWPGTVRELRNALEQAAMLTDNVRLTADDFKSILNTKSLSQRLRPLPQLVAELERSSIQSALAATGGNKVSAAKLLGISRATLYEKLKEVSG